MSFSRSVVSDGFTQHYPKVLGNRTWSLKVISDSTIPGVTTIKEPFVTDATDKRYDLTIVFDDQGTLIVGYAHQSTPIAAQNTKMVIGRKPSGGSSMTFATVETAELNPIENLWHYLKSHFWSNRTYADYDDLETAAMAAWQKAVLNTKLIQTVCAATYLHRASSD